MSIEAMKQALEALEGWANHGKWVWPESALDQCKRNTAEAITALRAAIDAELEQAMLEVWQTAPSWVGLTDEEVHQGFCHVEYETPNDWNTDPDDWCQQFARYLEAKLKEKNT